MFTRIWFFFPFCRLEPFSEAKGRKLLSSPTAYTSGEKEQSHLCTHLGNGVRGRTGELSWVNVDRQSFPLIFLMRSDRTHLSNEGHLHTQKPKTPEREARVFAAAATMGKERVWPCWVVVGHIPEEAVYSNVHKDLGLVCTPLCN